MPAGEPDRWRARDRAGGSIQLEDLRGEVGVTDRQLARILAEGERRHVPGSFERRSSTWLQRATSLRPSHSDPSASTSGKPSAVAR